MSVKELDVAVVGATGAVGQEILKILESRAFPVRRLVPFASARSAGTSVRFRQQEHACRVLEPGCFNGLDVAFFDASDEVSRQWVPVAVAAGCWVIDNSATFRLDPDVLLLVPEVNGARLEERLKKNFEKAQGGSAQAMPERARILTGPNCSTVQMVMALKPLHERFTLKRVVVSTYQSVSGAGKLAIDELKAQTRDYLAGVPFESTVFPHQIAFNCIPQVGGFKEDGMTSEEQKMIAESRKLLDLPALRLSVTAVRVPTIGCHGESVNAEFERPVDLAEARLALMALAGISLLDDPSNRVYPLGEATESDRVEGGRGRDAVYVGRVRRDPSVENGLNLWVVSDNLRKGAALNAVQIGESLVGLLSRFGARA